MTIGLVALLLGAGATAATTGLPAATPGRATIEKIIHEYIVSHPEVITEAVEELRRRDVTKAVDANRAQIETPFAGAWEGSANPKVTLVEFFDYNCGYCRAALPVVDRLLKDTLTCAWCIATSPSSAPKAKRLPRSVSLPPRRGSTRRFIARSTLPAAPTPGTSSASPRTWAYPSPSRPIPRHRPRSMQTSRSRALGAQRHAKLGGRQSGPVGQCRLRRACRRHREGAWQLRACRCRSFSSHMPRAADADSSFWRHWPQLCLLHRA